MSHTPKGEVVRILIFNYQQLILLVKSRDRHNVWELPGGKVELGETFLQAAIRELWEEVGLEVPDLQYAGAFDKVHPRQPDSFWRHYLYYKKIALPEVKIDHNEIIDFCFMTYRHCLEMGLEDASRVCLEKIAPPHKK